MAWQSFEMYDLKRNAFLHKKVKTKINVWGNETNQFAVSYENLSLIPVGSIGIIVEYDESPSVPADFVTVRFQNGLFANIALSTFDFIHDGPTLDWENLRQGMAVEAMCKFLERFPKKKVQRMPSKRPSAEYRFIP